MCGLITLFDPRGQVDHEALEAGLDALEHRGPDGRGHWFGPGIAMGHTRLAIRALDGGRQPMQHGPLVGAITGELYGLDPATTTSQSDSAALLPLVQAHGADAVHHLRGEFAFVAWHRERRVLHAARDAFGVRPLYYGWADGTLVLASEVKALAAAGVPLRWDEHALACWLATGLFPEGRTLYAGVSELPPAHRMRVDDAGVQVSRWWQWPARSLGSAGPGAALGDAVEQAVELRLASDRPIACALSGGLDSATVLALASRRSSVTAYGVGFDEAELDELGQAEQVAKVLDVPFRGVRIRERDLAEHYAATVRATELPLVNAHGVARWLMCRQVAADGHAVLLTGEGGDELFAGYPHLRQDAGAGDPAALAQVAVEARSSWGLLHGPLAPGQTPAFVRQRQHAATQLRQLLRSDVLAAWDATDHLAEVMPTPRPSGGSRLERAQQLWARRVLPRYQLAVLGDRVELAHGVEGRPPLLDVPLAELAAQLPEDQRVRGDLDKWALRHAARAWLPEAVRLRRKQPFLAPPMARASGPLLELLQDTLRDGPELPLLSPERLGLLVEVGLPTEDRRLAQALDPILHVSLSLALIARQLGVSAA